MKNKKSIIKDILIPILIFICLFLGMAGFQLLPLLIFNIDINKFSKGMQILYEFFCSIGFMVIVFYLYKEKLIDNFKKFFKNFKSNMDECFKYYFIGLLIMVISNLIISLFFKDATPNNENLVREMIKNYPLYMAFSVSIHAPFIEELIFRQSIKDIFISYKDNIFTKYAYILFSGILFGAMHIIGTDITSIFDYLYLIPYSSLGIVFAYLCYKTDNIFSSISMHFIHNTVSLLLLFLVGI